MSSPQFFTMNESTKNQLKGILEERASIGKTRKRSPREKVGSFYSSQKQIFSRDYMQREDFIEDPISPPFAEILSQRNNLAVRGFSQKNSARQTPKAEIIQKFPTSVRDSPYDQRQFNKIKRFTTTKIGVIYDNPEEEQARERSQSFKRDRSLSKSRIQQMSQDERQAFIAECRNLKDFIKESVQSVTKMIDSNEDTFRRKQSTSPKKRSGINLHNFLSVKEYRALNKIQMFLKHKIKVRRMFKRLKTLKPFRMKLLAVYKGYILRKKILKSIIIRNLIKDLKLMKRKQSVERYNKQNNISLKQKKSIQQQIYDKTQQLIDKINEYYQKRMYLVKKLNIYEKTKVQQKLQLLKESTLKSSKNLNQYQDLEQSQTIDPTPVPASCLGFYNNNDLQPVFNSPTKAFGFKGSHVEKTIKNSFANEQSQSSSHNQVTRIQHNQTSQMNNAYESPQITKKHYEGKTRQNTLYNKPPTISSLQEKRNAAKKESSIKRQKKVNQSKDNASQISQTSNIVSLETQDNSGVVGKTLKNKKHQVQSQSQSKVDCWRTHQERLEKEKQLKLMDDNQIYSAQENIIKPQPITQHMFKTPSKMPSKMPHYDKILLDLRGIMTKIESYQYNTEGQIDQKGLRFQMEKHFIDLRREFDLLCLEKFQEQ